MIEFVPPIKNKSVFVLYIVQQDNGIVTASSDFVGESGDILNIGMDVLSAVNSLSQHVHPNLVVSNKIARLNAQ